MGVCVSERIQLKLKGPWDKASIARMDHLKDELNESCPDLSISGKIREDNDYLSIDWSNDGGYYFFDAIDQLFEEANNREIIEEYHALEETMAEKKLFFLVRDWQECEGYAETEVYELFYGGKSWKRIYGKLKDLNLIMIAAKPKSSICKIRRSKTNHSVLPAYFKTVIMI